MNIVTPIDNVIDMLEVGTISPNQALARIAHIIISQDALADGDDIDLLAILTNPTFYELVHKLDGPLDVQSMVLYDLDMDFQNTLYENQSNLHNVRKIKIAIAFVLKERNPAWTINANESTALDVIQV